MAGGSMKEIRHRIKSVESTRQITKAMELVASSKLRKARERVESSRPMFELIYSTMSELITRNSGIQSVYTESKPIKHSGFIVIAGDRGLAGGYNSNLLKYAGQLMQGKNVKLIPIGRKVEEYFSRRDVTIIKHPYRMVEDLGVSEAFKLGEMIAELFAKGEFDELYLVYTNFVSVLNQNPAHIAALPLTVSNEKKNQHSVVLYEPSPESVLSKIVPQYLGGLIYGAVSESFVSEQGARRTAMEAANKNADEMIESLNLKYNRARQTAITQEITEIVAGAQALE